MVDVTPRRVGRPRRAVLDRDRIGATALAIVDETGDFTVPELARRLGVQPASLYHHVEGRAGIIELLREQIGEGVDGSALELQRWDEAIPAYFRSYRAVFAAHPRVVPLLTTTTIRSPKVLACYDRMVVLLTDAGVALARAMEVLTAIDSFALGSALDLAAPEVMWEVSDPTVAPHLAEALAAQRDATRRAEAAFECGLEMLLAGVAAEVAAAGQVGTNRHEQEVAGRRTVGGAGRARRP